MEGWGVCVFWWMGRGGLSYILRVQKIQTTTNAIETHWMFQSDKLQEMTRHSVSQ